MAITKETVVDKIEVLEMGQVQVRTATKIIEELKHKMKYCSKEDCWLQEIKDKKVLQKIILCDVQKEIYPELEKALLNLLHTSGYPNIKFEKKVDFDELYNKQFN